MNVDEPRTINPVWIPSAMEPRRLADFILLYFTALHRLLWALLADWTAKFRTTLISRHSPAVVSTQHEGGDAKPPRTRVGYFEPSKPGARANESPRRRDCSKSS
jgi:hypothetical protein